MFNGDQIYCHLTLTPVKKYTLDTKKIECRVVFPSNALNNEINYILFVFKNFKMNLLSRFRFYFFTILHLHIFVYLCIKWDALCLFHYWLKDFVLDFYCISIKQFSLSCMWVSNDCRIIGTVLLTDLHLQKLRWTHLWH